MVAALLEQLSLTDVLLIVGLTGVALDRLADARGWLPSSKRLRRENEDLVRRNTELEQTVARHEQTIATQGAALNALEQKVAELEKRDQAAVLAAIERHETNAASRQRESLAVLTDIRDHLKGASA